MITEQNRTEIVSRIQARLAAGYPRQRMIVECGFEQQNHLDRLIKQDFKRDYGRNCTDADRDYYREVDAYLATLGEWLREDDSEQVVASLASTPTYQMLHNAFDHARTTCDLLAIIGAMGIGKSTAARGYVALNPRTEESPGFVYVQFNTGCNKAGPALHAICAAVIGDHAGRRTDGMIHDIGREMRPGDGLILDECNYLVDALDAIRDLWEAYKIPIITMGNPNFTGMVAGNRPTFAAFASRAMPFPIKSNTEADVDAWMKWSGLSGKSLRDLFIVIACKNGGGLRSIASLVTRFKSIRPGEPLTAANLRGMAGALLMKTNSGGGVQ